MSLFPRFTQEFSPIFRLFDDYERQFKHFDQHIRSFSPKFDVKETEDSYELHGEFPGIEQKDINIEWTDANTLSITGRHETVKEEGRRPTAAIEDGKPAAAVEDAKPESEKKEQQPTVEDENADSSAPAAETQVAKKTEQEIAKKGENEPKYWVSERSVGSFHRSFAFPARVDQDAVKASLKNGILSIVVPKAKAPQPKKINIE
jgi:HSP20 family molecular chaperone IbpA